MTPLSDWTTLQDPHASPVVVDFKGLFKMMRPDISNILSLVVTPFAIHMMEIEKHGRKSNLTLAGWLVNISKRVIVLCLLERKRTIVSWNKFSIRPDSTRHIGIAVRPWFGSWSWSQSFWSSSILLLIKAERSNFKQQRSDPGMAQKQVVGCKGLFLDWALNLPLAFT